MSLKKHIVYFIALLLLMPFQNNLMAQMKISILNNTNDTFEDANYLYKFNNRNNNPKIIVKPTCRPWQTIPKDSLGKISGTVSDAKTKEPIINAYTRLFKNGHVIAFTVTDYDGKFEFDSLQQGMYSLIETYIGYDTFIKKYILIIPDSNTEVNIFNTNKYEFSTECPVIEYKVPLIDHNYPTKKTFTRQQLHNLPY